MELRQCCHKQIVKQSAFAQQIKDLNNYYFVLLKKMALTTTGSNQAFCQSWSSDNAILYQSSKVHSPNNPKI
jgi:hypothetical protein